MNSGYMVSLHTHTNNMFEIEISKSKEKIIKTKMKEKRELTKITYSSKYQLLWFAFSTGCPWDG